MSTNLIDLVTGAVAVYIGMDVMGKINYVSDITPDTKLLGVLISGFIMLWGANIGLAGFDGFVDQWLIKRHKSVNTTT